MYGYSGKNRLTAAASDAIIMCALSAEIPHHMRECWNWQTGTFEVRVLLAYGFKSRFSHQRITPQSGLNACFVGLLLFLIIWPGVYLVFVKSIFHLFFAVK